jgi:non-ribosomal peptide synthetase component F
VEWNNTQIEYPKDRCVHQLFEAQVEKTPDAVALVFADREISYRELNSRSNQLAHYLRKQGVREEVLVGLCLERSPEMVIGMLGILKAGGAYLPLDPSYPAERLSVMLEDAQVPVLLTQQPWVERISKNQPQVICFDTDGETIALENADNLTHRVTLITLFMLFTLLAPQASRKPFK